MQKILKNNWRKLTQIVLDGLVRFMGSNDLASFVLMVVICLCNFTVLLFVWIRFYNNLEQKIIATEYILTFIPIDEINKNPKIVKYIKQDILDKK